MLSLVAALALAQPVLQHRWFYLQTNLLVPANADAAVALLERAAKAGYNGMVITDSKFTRLGDMPPAYFAHCERVRQRAGALKISIIPAVMGTGWADGLLSHNPNLIESMPVRDATFVLRGGTFSPEDTAVISNGDLQRWQGDKAVGFSFQDGVGVSSFVDRQVVQGGSPSVRFERFREGNEAGNGRLITSSVVKPWNQYRLSAWFKSQDLRADDSVKLMAIGADGKALSFFRTGISGTKDWRKVSVVFNSQSNERVNLYAGVWGGRNGKLWIANLSLQNAGLLNVVRRPGTPVKVLTAEGRELKEGTDYERVEDPKLGTTPWRGAFTFDHEPPTLRVLPSARIEPGERLRVSFYHAVATDEGKTAICLSEPQTWEILKDETRGVQALWKPNMMLAAHDENRVAGWCGACVARRKSPGEMMAEDQRRCASIIRSAIPGAPAVAVWSDMFDPHHNAVAGYYLSNGSWAGAWKGLDSRTTVLNWASFTGERSLRHFEDLGTPQVLAGYYDGPVDSIRKWLDRAQPYKTVRGVMYTTWANDYSKLEEFAEAAWRAR